MRRDPIREKPHRLPRPLYRGHVAVAFTARIAAAQRPFADGRVVRQFVAMLGNAATQHGCIVPVYCFMPDHVHLVLQGQHPNADGWRAMTAFKQRSGYWMPRHLSGVRWQKDFYDHIIRSEENLITQLRYVADNPVRKGLVEQWPDYPFTGAIGFDLAGHL